jgi:hypothetical protein
MSYKHTYLAWQSHNITAEEKLVLLKLADISGADGLASFFLKDLTQECLCEEFKLSNTLFSLSQKGLIAMGRAEREGNAEKHSCRLLLTEESTPQTTSQPINTLKVVESSEPSSRPAITPIEQSPAPQWTAKTYDFYNIPVQMRNVVWQTFTKQHGRGNINLPRLERDFENWLHNAKRNGELARLEAPGSTSAPAMHAQESQSYQPNNPHSGSEYINSHDLNEKEIPSWAEKTLYHSGLEMDLALFWEEFVYFQKGRPNNYAPMSQHLNKLRYSINWKKQRMSQDKQNQARYHQRSDAKSVSPSEEFREFLRDQGKKPSF